MEVKTIWGGSYTIVHKETEVRQFAFNLGRIDRILTTNRLVWNCNYNEKEEDANNWERYQLEPGEIQMH